EPAPKLERQALAVGAHDRRQFPTGDATLALARRWKRRRLGPRRSSRGRLPARSVWLSPGALTVRRRRRPRPEWARRGGIVDEERPVRLCRCLRTVPYPCKQGAESNRECLAHEPSITVGGF